MRGEDGEEGVVGSEVQDRLCALATRKRRCEGAVLEFWLRLWTFLYKNTVVALHVS
jgi:hypothetical protein